MSSRGPVFHIGCLSLAIAAIVGYPLGSSVAKSIWGHNAGPLGGMFGFFALMLILGYIARQRQIRRGDHPD